MDLDAIRRKVSAGEYSVRPHALHHTFKESFSQEDMEYVGLHGKITEEYPDRCRCLICGFITTGKRTKSPLHVVCASIQIPMTWLTSSQPTSPTGGAGAVCGLEGNSDERYKENLFRVQD